MLVRPRIALVAATTLTCAGLLGTAPATAVSPTRAETPATVKVIAKNLNGPRQLTASGRYFYVAESDPGQIARVTRAGGARKTVVKKAVNAQGVARTGGRLYIASGATDPDVDPGATGGTTLYVAKDDSKPKVFADLLAYELKHDPDNQTQFGSDGKPLDALSNPYFVLKSKVHDGFLLVADAGGNDVLAVSRSGKVSTFFVPPSVSSGECGVEPPPGVPGQNSDAGPSCDAVPTGLAYGPGGSLYISALTSEVAEQGRVYVVDKNGKLLKTLSGFSAPTGVAVAPDGTVYVSELLQGLPEEPATARTATVAPTRRQARAAASPAFDPSTVGQVVKVAPDGTRTYAQVTMPSGLLYTDGTLYASAWSIAAQLGGPANAGQVVSVDPASFLPA